jgi:hypothetical protein
MRCQADLTLVLLPLCLGGDGHTTSEDHIDLHYMLIVVGILSMVFAPTGDLEVPTLLVAASSCNPEKSCTSPDHVLQCDGSRTTFLHRRDAERASFPSALRTACRNIRDLLGPCNLPGQRC